MSDLSLAARLTLDAQRWTQGLSRAGTGLRGFRAGAKREIAGLADDFGRFRNSIEGRLAGLGVSVGAGALLVQSARLDKSLTQTGLTAGVSGDKVAGLRKELFRLGRISGREVDELNAGFTNLVAQGLDWTSSLAVIDATNSAMAVTGARAESLTSALGVAKETFGFDLSAPGVAVDLLDKMTVAGRAGSAELENLSSIFSIVGPTAARANLSFNDTLGFIEGLSKIRAQPEQLRTLADSTLRLFKNSRLISQVQKTTGVKFFDTDGARRDAFDVIGDLKQRFDKLGTDLEQQRFFARAFKGADLDTVGGFEIILNDKKLAEAIETSKKAAASAGTIGKDVDKAIGNAIDQAGRLKSVLREAADEFAAPINEAFTAITRKALDKKSEGGLELGGGQLLAGGALAAAALVLGKRFGGKALSAISGRLGGTAAGVAEGKALEAAAGVTPVFVTNFAQFPGGSVGIGDAVSGGAAAKTIAGRASSVLTSLRTGIAVLTAKGTASIGALAATGAAGIATISAAVTGSALVGAGIGTAVVNRANQSNEGIEKLDSIGRNVAQVLALFGNDEAERALVISEPIRKQRDAQRAERADFNATTERLGRTGGFGSRIRGGARRSAGDAAARIAEDTRVVQAFRRDLPKTNAIRASIGLPSIGSGSGPTSRGGARRSVDDAVARALAASAGRGQRADAPPPQRLEGELNIVVDDRRVSVGKLRSNSPGVTITAETGKAMVGA